MNKAHLIAAHANRHDLSPRKAAAELDRVLDTVARALAAGERVDVPAGTRLRFRPGQNLRDLVSGERPVPATGFAVTKAAKYSKTPGRAR